MVRGRVAGFVLGARRGRKTAWHPASLRTNNRGLHLTIDRVCLSRCWAVRSPAELPNICPKPFTADAATMGSFNASIASTSLIGAPPAQNSSRGASGDVHRALSGCGDLESGKDEPLAKLARISTLMPAAWGVRKFCDQPHEPGHRDTTPEPPPSVAMRSHDASRIAMPVPGSARSAAMPPARRRRS